MRSIMAVIIVWLQGLVAALQFLTRLPLPMQIPYTEKVISRSVVFYPIAGLLIGAFTGGAALLLVKWLPVLPAAALVLAIWIALTGGLHLDGLMDTADGILSHRSRERMLEIMKDSRVGAMGVIVCVLYLLLKFSLLYTLMALGDWTAVLPIMILVPVWSRWFMTAAIYRWPYVRGDSGLGSILQGVKRSHVLLSTLASVIPTVCIIYLWSEASGSSSFLHAGVIACGYLLAAGGIGYALAAYISRKLGGLTGDTYGAINELLEVALLIASVIYL